MPRRVLRVALLGVTMLVLAGCSEADQHQIRNLAMPDRASAQGPYTYELWKWAWVAAMVTGVIVWGLIFYAVVRFRRRSDDEVPRQTRYNLPLEVFYTIAPVLMCVVFFFHTVRVQDEVIKIVPDPDMTVEVTGQQWSWTFNYGVGDQDTSATGEPAANGEEGDFAYDEYVYTSGTGRDIPTLVLPVDQTIQFNLHSPDVIHDFGVPAFLVKMDVIPGRVNKLQVTPTVEGTYKGKCYELCGVSHSRMLFNVEVVSQEEYDSYLSDLAEAGNTAASPVLGGTYVNDQVGLETASEGAQE
ncbi:aa3-type cytochrome oxidase subunit II [Nocardioides okcheonensis]|uniref:aa3-type cytochrome oxidase subunit II n=1 Tax=Nocardioides okcheonensis TaxID=2894081 RepID=UPI001E46FDD0|nr:cytochrome c oxidase subunit II [Nocardioides okcheonensis]UFN45632.1 cytochrome c oxidase subunit II [Nocardioides okcheonensis]